MRDFLEKLNTFSFHVVNAKTQVQLKSHGRIGDSWMNNLRPNVKGMLANGLQSKAKKPREAVILSESCGLESYLFIVGTGPVFITNIVVVCLIYTKLTKTKVRRGTN